MTLTTENILLIGSILLFLSLVAGKTSFRFGVPVLILFLTIGMLAGSEGIGKIHFDNPGLAQFIGIVALNFILFSGGLDTDWHSVRPVLWQGVTLSTIGVLLTALSIGIFVWAVTDFSIFEGLLLGSIVSSTDSAAVFSILRSKNLALKGSLRPVLELESGSNDPMAYILTILFTTIVTTHEASAGVIIPMFLSQLLLGGAMGFIMGKAGAFIINRIRLDYEGLYVVLVIALMLFTFAATDYMNGNGFLAVYVSAIFLGNKDLIHKKTILKSFDSFAWLMQIVLFLTLGLLVFPSQVVPVIGIGLLISLFLMFFARPLSVYLCLLPFRLQNRSRLFISWVGLRGAVPIVFATYPLIAGADKANMIFNIVFFISITSVLIQGTTLPLVAKWLHLTLPQRLKHRTHADLEIEECVKTNFTRIIIPDNCEIAGKQIVEIGLPKSSIISFIKRDGRYITPSGSTVIQEDDHLFVLTESRETLAKVFERLHIEFKKDPDGDSPGAL